MKKFWRTTASFLGLLGLLAGVWGLNGLFAQQQTKTASSFATSSRSAVIPMLSKRTVNMTQVPALTPGAASQHTGLPALEDNPQAFASHKQAAVHNAAAPHSSSYHLPENAQPNTPTFIARIQGMTDAVCGGKCQPPDMALAVSTSWIFQGVNASFAVYLKTGLQPGWPKSAQSFFGVPSLPNNCDPTGPFLADPRAYYDVNDGRFWAAMIQVEDAAGIAPNCPEQTELWIAVSQTSNPNGVWNVYEFNMALGTTNIADYTQFGFDNQAIYFSANMFNQAGTIFQYAEAFGASKKTMEQNQAVTAFGGSSFSVNGVLIDTMQPVEVESPNGSPYKSGLFINSFNMNSGGGTCSSGCSGVVVWADANPGTSGNTFTSTTITTNSYVMPAQADQPSCNTCVETLDTRITGTPVYHGGLISFALETGVNNGTQVVPGIFWGQVAPVLNDAGAVTSGSVYQQGYFNFGSDNAASFGAVMPNNDGDLLMVFELMGHTVNPEVAYVTRRVTSSLGAFHDHGSALQAGATSTTNTRWGDFEATSYDYYTSNDIWFAGQYASSTGGWATTMGEVDLRFTDA